MSTRVNTSYTHQLTWCTAEPRAHIRVCRCLCSSRNPLKPNLQSLVHSFIHAKGSIPSYLLDLLLFQECKGVYVLVLVSQHHPWCSARHRSSDMEPLLSTPFLRRLWWINKGPPYITLPRIYDILYEYGQDTYTSAWTSVCHVYGMTGVSFTDVHVLLVAPTRSRPVCSGI